MMDREMMLEILEDTEALTADGFDDCIIGIAERCSKQPLVIYDSEKMIEKMMKDGMSHEEAVEYFDFNILGAWMGEGTPLFLTRLEEN